jgi:hypothetical protein
MRAFLMGVAVATVSGVSCKIGELGGDWSVSAWLLAAHLGACVLVCVLDSWGRK